MNIEQDDWGFRASYLYPILDRLGLMDKFDDFMRGQTCAIFDNETIIYYRDVRAFCAMNDIVYGKLFTEYLVEGK